jgi:tRNA(Ile)-lysidine synthase
VDAGEGLRKALAPLHGRRLLVGFSGGMDSTVLLHALAASGQAFAGLRAIHVDHGLHADSARWARHCQDTCDALGVELQLQRVRVRTRGKGLEAAARDARLAAFAAALDAGETLVLAQHRDDQAETLLLRLLRGAGSDGLGAMRAARGFAAGTLARPLLELPRARLHDYAIAQGLAWLDDPSNADLRHDRNHLRHVMLPALRARWPQADLALATSARLAGEDAGLLADEAAQRLAGVRLPGEPGALSVPTLLALSPAWRARVLRAWFVERGLPPAPARMHHRIDTDLLSARRDATPEIRWPGACLRRWRDGVHGFAAAPRAATPPASDDWSRRWDGAGWLALPDGSQLGFEALDASAFAQGSAGWPGIVQRAFGELRVGPRQGGERLRLPGRSHHHRLKHLLQADGVPPWRREGLPLLRAGDGELLAAGDGLVGARLAEWSGVHGCALRWRRRAG